jgi:hypothetical protein
MCLVCFTVVLLGRDTGLLQLLAPLLLTGGNGADLLIRGNVVLNSLIMTMHTQYVHAHGPVLALRVSAGFGSFMNQCASLSCPNKMSI